MNKLIAIWYFLLTALFAVLLLIANCLTIFGWYTPAIWALWYFSYFDETATRYWDGTV